MFVKSILALLFIAVPLFIYFLSDGVWLVLLVGYCIGFLMSICYITGTQTSTRQTENCDVNGVIFIWLNNIGLTVYYDILIDEGYETIDDLLTITENALKQLNITKQMHVKKILKKINDSNGMTNTDNMNTTENEGEVL